MILITLARFRKKPTKEVVEQLDKLLSKLPRGVKIISRYWTLGRYDGVVTFEAPNEKEAMAFLLKFGDIVATETLVGVPREEAVKLIR